MHLDYKRNSRAIELLRGNLIYRREKYGIIKMLRLHGGLSGLPLPGVRL